MTEYTFVQDDGSDWYLVPVDKERDWWVWCENPEVTEWQIPDYAIYIQDPGSISITSWKEI